MSIDIGPPTAAEIAASEAIAAGSSDYSLWPWSSTFGASVPQNLPAQPSTTIPMSQMKQGSIWSEIGSFISQITPSISSAIRGPQYGYYPYGGYSANGQYLSPYGSNYPYGSGMSSNLLLYLGLGLLAVVLIMKSSKAGAAHAGAH